MKKLRLFLVKGCVLVAFLAQLSGFIGVYNAKADVPVIFGPVTNVANGHIYYLLSSSTWTEAEAKAVTLGGHLVTVNDAVEDDWVYVNFSGFGGTNTHLWIGLTDQAQEGTFVWASGQPVTYTHWFSGEPNNSGGNENYAYIDTPDSPRATTWNDGADTIVDSFGFFPRGVVEVPPQLFIESQPTNRTAFTGNATTFLVAASGMSPLYYQWRFNGGNITNATNASYTIQSVQTNHAGIYSVMVSNALDSLLSSNAVLTVVIGSPLIVSEPTNRTILVGSTTTFTATAAGSMPLSYQWFFNTNNLINGATNTSLTLTNVQVAQAGIYSLRVTNVYGSTNSSNALLVVTFPTPVIRVLNTNTMGGAPVTVPILIAANGNENTLGFSLNFSTQRLAFASVTWGSGVSGANAFVNTNQAATLGRIGFGITFPAGTAFAFGTQEVVNVTFRSLILLGGSPVNTTISFGDQPVLRELYDPQLQVLTATYSSGMVMLSPSVLESDVFPRTNGNQAVTTTDFAQMGRFVARLDAAIGQEFQRADCAPKSTLGDGQMKVTDWVQAGRYIAGFDPLVALGGPTNEVAPTAAGSSGSRQFRVTSTNVFHEESTEMSVILDTQGNENALGFTITFNPAAVTYGGLELGSGAAGASLTVNSSQVSVGQIGVVLTLPTGNTFSAGSEELVQVSFVASPDVAGPFPVSLTDQLLARCVSDVFANELPVSYVNGTVTVNPVNPNPTLVISRSSGNVVISWPLWASDFFLQAREGTNGVQGVWTNVSITQNTNGSTVFVTSPIGNTSKFFRLYHP